MNRQRVTHRLRIAAYIVLCVGLGILVGSRAWPIRTAVPSVAAAPAVTAGSLEQGFAAIVEKDLPAVVNISSSKVVRNNTGEVSPFFNDPFFRQFFGDQFGRQFRVPPKQWERSLGSGVIVNPDGYLLTNNHVIDGATDISVTLLDKREFKAKVVGTDPKTDIAILKVDAKNLPTLPFADSSKARVGDLVLAIGEPFGLGGTVTMGIISAKGRAIGIEQYEDFIQTDAAINPGNSGGALIDTHGQLIGINTAILTHGSGGNQGVGFAVPANLARQIMNQVLEHGKVIRGYMGLLPQDITPAIAKEFHLADTQGVLVGDVTAGTPAAEAGVQRGDVIREIDGQKIEDSNQLRFKVAMIPPGTIVHLKLIRDGNDRTVAVKLAEQPAQTEMRERSGGGGGSTGLDGVSVENLTSQALRELNLPMTTKGVVVTDVADGSPAAMAGLRSGDVIQEVNRQPVTSVADFDRALRGTAGHTVLLLVNRGGTTMYIAIEAR